MILILYVIYVHVTREREKPQEDESFGESFKDRVIRQSY